MISLKYKWPNIILTLGDSFSGKSLRHADYLNDISLYFIDTFSNIVIISDRESLAFWRDIIRTPTDKNVFFYDYEQVEEKLGKNPPARTIFLIDDLTWFNYKKILEFMEFLTSIFCHHGKSIAFLISQNLVPEMRNLLSRISELHICAANNSSFKYINYLTRFYFPTAEKKLILKGLEAARKSKEDNYLILKMKNYVSPIIVNKLAFLKNMTPYCWTICDHNPSDLEFRGKNGWYINRPSDNVRGFIRLKNLLDVTTRMNTDKDDDEYVLFPKKAYLEAISLTEEEEEEKEEVKLEPEHDGTFENLSRNLISFLNDSFPTQKRNSAVKLGHELLRNSNIIFSSVLARSFRVINTTEMMNTWDFIYRIITPDLPFKNRKKPKINLNYVAAVQCLLNNHTPSGFIVNKTYIKYCT